jgi:hypothetical protein
MRRATVPIVMAMALVSVVFASAGPTAAGVGSPVHGADAGCGPGLVAVADGLCTHGGDRVPPTVDGAATRAATVARSKPSELCAGNGKHGRRIRVLYGYPSDTTSRAAAFRSWVRDSVAMADANLDAQTPGIDGQHLRMYCQNGRRVTVSSIELLPIGDTTFTFTDMVGSLVDRVANGLGDADFDAPRFTYVVFVDNVTCCYGPGGQGTIYWDDRGDPAVNRNNQAVYGPRFAMVKIPGSISSGAYIFLHEVGHTLGAVQHSSPHSSGAGHCYTSADVMCYADGGPWFAGGGTMQQICDPMSDGQYPFDCGGGDYYEVDPAPGSYLAGAWNTADSGWLTKPG